MSIKLDGQDLFNGSESFMNELSEDSFEQIKGGDRIYIDFNTQPFVPLPKQPIDPTTILRRPFTPAIE